MTASDDAAADHSLAAADASSAPGVARPESRWALPAGIAGVLALGVATFAGLHRPAAPPASADLSASGLPITTRAPSSTASLPPPPVLTPAFVPPAAAMPVPPPAPVTIIAPRYTAPLPPPPRPGQSAPALIVDLAAPVKPVDPVAKIDGTAEKLSSNEAFAARLNRSAVDTVTTDRLSSTDKVIPQGTIIAGVLETAINSDLPGQIRAVFSRDVPGFDGTMILIPRGSRLIGQYSNGVALGQSRAFVIWTRLLRSDGVSVQLGSAGTDELGTAGLGGKVNSHFLRRFGAATLLSVITAGLAYLGNSSSNGNSVVIASPGQANQLAGIALQREIDVPPTIKVAQGTPIRVFVAKDLDFGNVKVKSQ